LIGLARTLELAAFDEAIPAKKAHEWGMATKVVDDGSSLESAKVLLSIISKKITQRFWDGEKSD